MINLLSQLQIIVISFLAGLFGSWIWDYLYQIFYQKHHFIVKLIESVIYMMLMSLLLFYFLFITNDAYLTLYIPLFVIFGIATYFIVYYDYVNKHIKKVSKKIEKVRMKIYNQFTKIKKGWENGKSRKRKKKHLDYTKN